MKKKLFTLLAMVLLSSVSVFAQSSPINPAKGDVNGDGVVDVADITAVIEIMKNGGGTVDNRYYFSVGTTVPTASNYTTVNNATTDIPTTQEFTNNSGNKAYIYILVPSNKTVTATDLAITSIISPLIEDISITIPNHKVYVTDGKIAYGVGIKVTLKTEEPEMNYYWYVGTTKPTSLDQCAVVSEYPIEQTYTNPSSSEKNYFHVLTTTDKTVDFYDPSDLSTPSTKEEDLETIPGYKITSMTVRVAKGGTQVIKISDAEPTYYWYVGQTDPSTMTEISPIVTDNTSAGWREIGTTLPTYTMDNPLWDGSLNKITTGDTRATTYVALPNSTLKVRDGDGNDVTTSVYSQAGTKVINSVTYYIYKIDNVKIFNAIIF